MGDEYMSGISRSQNIIVSKHALKRWFQRSATPEMDPALAWAEATEIRGHGLEGDEVRYHTPSETVIIRKGNTLVTVIAVESAMPTVRTAVTHVDRQTG